jgi:hypothetical protein
MPSYRFDIVTTSPVAVRKHCDFHVRDQGGPWHVKAYEMSCPDCKMEFVADETFSKDFLLVQLKTEHGKGKEHPFFIASEPAFTRVEPCTCN